MAVIVNTMNPGGLLAAIKKAIDDGHIRTWSYDMDGDFTHTPEQWKNAAWLRPSIAAGVLRFGLLKNTKRKVTKALYGVYHGRFIEELLTHFDTVTGEITATPLPLTGIDQIAA